MFTSPHECGLYAHRSYKLFDCSWTSWLEEKGAHFLHKEPPSRIFLVTGLSTLKLSSQLSFK